MWRVRKKKKSRMMILISSFRSMMAAHRIWQRNTLGGKEWQRFSFGHIKLKLSKKISCLLYFNSSLPLIAIIISFIFLLHCNSLVEKLQLSILNRLFLWFSYFFLNIRSLFLKVPFYLFFSHYLPVPSW